MKTSDTITKISASINKSQSKFMHVVKDVKGARGLYASLPAVIESVRPILNENGISVLQHSHPSETGVCLSTVLLHTSGEWIADGGLFIPCVKNDPQAFGSAMSYARRYSLLAMLGVAADDDVAREHRPSDIGRAAIERDWGALVLTVVAADLHLAKTAGAGRVDHACPRRGMILEAGA